MVMLVGVTLLPFALYTAYQAWHDREQGYAQALDESERFARRGAHALEQHIDRIVTLLATLEPVVAEERGDPAALERHLRRVFPSLAGVISTLNVVAPDGNVIATGRPAPYVNIADRPHFQAALQTRARAISEPLQIRQTGEWAVVVASPVLDGDGRVVAVITVATGLDQVDRLLEANSPGAGAQLALISAQGASIAHWHDDARPRGGDLRALPQFQAARSGQTFRGEVTTSDGVARIGASVPVRTAPWQLFVGIPRAEALAAANEQMRSHLMIAVAMLLISLCAALVFARGLARPVMELRRAVRELSRDGLSHPAARENGGEIGALAADINHMAERLAETQARLHSMLSLSSDWYWETDAAFRFTSVEGTFAGTPEVDARWIIGRTYQECGLAHADHAAHARLLEQHLPYRNVEFSSVDREGRTLRVFLVSGTPRFGPDGAFLGYRGACRDVTESRVLQDSVRSARERLRLIVDSVPALIAYIDTDERYVFCNRQYAELFGTDPRGVVGRSVREVTGPATYDMVREGMQRAFEGKPARFEARFAGVSGVERDFLVHYVPDIAEAGKPLGFIGMVTDITELRSGQRALALSERRFRELTELSTDWYWEQDAELRFTYQSSQANGAADFTRFLGQRRWDQPASNMTEDDWAAHRAVLARREPFHDLELLRLDAAGMPSWGSVSGQPTFDANGRFAGYRGVGRNITARKIAEQALQAERDRLARIVETMAEGLAIVGPDGRYLIVNAVAATVFGAPRESIIGVHYADAPFRRVSGSATAARQEAGSQIFEAIRAGARLVGPVQMRIDRGDGEQRHITLKAARLHDESGGFAGVVSTFVDVTESVRAEARITESEARFRSLFELSQDGLAIHRDGRIERANSTFARLVGVASPDKLAGRHIAEIMVAGDREPMRGRIRQLLQGDVQRLPYTDARLLRADGTSLEIETAGTPLGAPGDARMSLVVRDLSDRKSHEREILKLNEELDRRVQERTTELRVAYRDMEAFSYNVSHDLRAPLRAMSGFSSMLMEDYGESLPKEAQRLLGRVVSNAERMEQLIEGLLAFGRMSRQPLVMRSVSLREIVEDVLEEARPAVSRQRGTVRVSALPDAWADPVLLRQVFANLVSNAIKYSMKCAHPCIEIGAIDESPGPTYFVRDNGAGFDMANAGKLFGMFQRLHSPSEFEGNGVGLAMVRRIIERHGGEIWAESAPGKGAAFYFRLDGRGIARDAASRPRGKVELREVTREGVAKPVLSA